MEIAKVRQESYSSSRDEQKGDRRIITGLRYLQIHLAETSREETESGHTCDIDCGAFRRLHKKERYLKKLICIRKFETNQDWRCIVLPFHKHHKLNVGLAGPVPVHSSFAQRS